MTEAVLWMAADAQAATGGRTSGDWSATGVSIDSRTLQPGDLFVALQGPNFDGHDFLEAAYENGAAASLVQRAPIGRMAELPHLLVDDTLGALWRLGAAARARGQAKIAAITGSAGKTSTKEALRHCLAAQAETAANVGSLNNHWGVPLSLARMRPKISYGVFELGMNNPGEILELARLVRPHVAVVTNVEVAHIGNFKSIMEIADAKAEIFQALEPGGQAVLNREHPLFHHLRAKALEAGVETIIGFGAHGEAEVRLVSFTPEAEGSRVEAIVFGQPLSYRLAAHGRHLALNSLAVLAACALLGGDAHEAATVLETLTPLKGRGARHWVDGYDGRFLLIDDSYNANPASMRAAFDVLAQSRPEGKGRRIAVLGDMLELGDTAEDLHAGLATDLAAAADRVYCCGPHMAALFAALPQDKRALHAPDSSALASLLSPGIRAGDVVLVKGSLGSRMACIVEALQDLGRQMPRAANGE
jgi:UDP-N-acetylmuramoyl-tripeptide--D-alanyl-D-alanine ligase